MKRPRWVIVAFVLLQIAIPTVVLAARWAGSDFLRFAWAMFSVSA